MMSDFVVTRENLDEALGVLRQVLDEEKRAKDTRIKNLITDIEDLEKRIETKQENTDPSWAKVTNKYTELNKRLDKLEAKQVESSNR